MSLKPWDAGYVAPVVDVAAIKAANCSKAGKLSKQMRDERVSDYMQLNPDATEEEVRANLPSKVKKHLATRTEENLSIEDRIFYQRFVTEYLVDFNATLAWIRAGGKAKSANTRGCQVIRTPYAQSLLRKLVDEIEESELVTRKQVVLGLWKEANDRDEGSSGGARVRALMGLARIKQMDIKVVENKKTITHNVMHVPMPVNNDAWAEAAEQSQQALKHDVRT